MTTWEEGGGGGAAVLIPLSTKAETNHRSCGKVPVWLTSETWVAIYSPQIPQILVILFVCFCWFVHGRGARQRQYWRLIPLSTRVGKIWQIVWQGPLLGFVLAQRREALSLNNPWVRFSWLLPCFLLFYLSVVLIPLCFSSSCCSFRAASSHLLLCSKLYVFLGHSYSVSPQDCLCFICYYS